MTVSSPTLYQPRPYIGPVLLLILLLLIVVSLATLGRYPLTVGQVIHVLLTTTPFGARGEFTNTPWVVVEIVRLPRILLVSLCGAGLALAGAAMQGVFRNPARLAGYRRGTAGAACGGVIAILLGFAASGIVGTAFLFGFGALALAFMLARLSGRAGTLALILAGVVIGSFFGSVLGLLEYLASGRPELPQIIYWLLGSFAGRDPTRKSRSSPPRWPSAGTLLLALRWRINVLSLDELDAAALGINSGILRWVIIGLVSLIVAAQVSVSGGVGWVGLVVPHLARMLVGPDHVRLLPTSALLGAIYLLVMDDIARSVGTQEIPIGLLTSAVGTPVFAFLFWKLGDRGWTTS